MALNPIVLLQPEIVNAYMARHNLSIDEFIALDDKYAILEFIEEGYEPFHLTGSEGILSELQAYIEEQKAIV